jgi:hypothetical protein
MLVRDDIDAWVKALLAELVPAAKPSVLFVCVHNASRSQMAAVYLEHLSGGGSRSARPDPNPPTP